MFKPKDLAPREIWRLVLSKLSTEDKLYCRPVCISFKKEVDSILKNNQDRLWLRHREADFGHYFCYDKDHRISFRDTLYFGKTISIRKLKFVSSLMPSLKILQLDPLDQVYQVNYDKYRYRYSPYSIEDPNYRDEKGKVLPITKMFPVVACLILPGKTEKQNFVGDLSQVKHLTLFGDIYPESHKFPNLESLEVLCGGGDMIESLPIPSKRLVVPFRPTDWRSLPKTLEVIERALSCQPYISVGKPHFENLKILKFPLGLSLYSLVNFNFLKDHKRSLTELKFSVADSTEEQVAAIKSLVPLLSQLQKLSVMIKTDKQAIQLKEIKALAHNLQYFELLFSKAAINRSNIEHLGPLLENLPIGLDNFAIKNVLFYEDIDTFMEKIIEKVVNGDTKRVTIADVEYDEPYPNDIIEEIVKMKPEPVRVEKNNSRKIVLDDGVCCSRSQYCQSICNIVISL